MTILIFTLAILLSSFHTLATPLQPQSSLNSTRATIRPPKLETPPNPYIYGYDSTHKVVFDRHTTAHSYRNPSISINNFEHALKAAGRIVLETQHHFRADGDASFPSNQFIYERELRRPSTHPSLQHRRFRLEIRGVHEFLSLTYDAVKIVMLGLFEYNSLWDKGFRPGSEPRVSVCNFTLFWEKYGRQRIAEGSVKIVVPAPPPVVGAAVSFW